MLVLNFFLFVLANSSPSPLSFPESYSINSDTQVSSIVLGPTSSVQIPVPDGNLLLCAIDLFLFGIRLQPVTNLPYCPSCTLFHKKLSAFAVLQDFPVAQLVKNPPAVQESACNTGDPGLIPGLGRCSGEGKGNPL